MINKELLKTIIESNQTFTLPKLIKRNIEVPLDSGQVVSIIGSRRSGKTYLLYYLIIRLSISKSIKRENIIYLNFEDERLFNFSIEDFDLIIQSQLELHPNIKIEEVYFLFDEIQNIDGWEKFVRRVHETINKNIYITGSNSKHLSSEISTTLRGRNITIEVYPLQFNEYLKFKDIQVKYLEYSPTKNAIMFNTYEQYLVQGGFPDILNLDKNIQTKVLQEYFNTMIYRDLIERYEITNHIALKFFINLLVQCHGSEISINKIYNQMKSSGVKISKDNLYEFLDNCKSIYLVLTINRFDYSLAVQQQSEKKLYVIDNGLFNSVSFKHSDDLGKLLESSIFYKLVCKHGKNNIFYFKQAGYECDFIVQDKNNVSQAIQVCVTMKDIKTREREIKGIVKTCEFFNLKNGIVVTLGDIEEQIIVNGITVNTIPAWKFCLLE
jgi:uncharacterized protein